MSAAAKIMLALALLALGAAGGWTAQGWRKDAQISDLQRDQADTNAGQYKAALDDFEAASKRINAAAAGAKVDLSAVNGQLAAIRKDFQNAKPLPIDCKPDAERVRRLTATAAAVDQAIARSVAGSAVPPEWPAGGRQ
jgi:hypothetical protein